MGASIIDGDETLVNDRLECSLKNYCVAKLPQVRGKYVLNQLYSWLNLIMLWKGLICGIMRSCVLKSQGFKFVYLVV